MIPAIQAIYWARDLLALAYPSQLGWQGPAANQVAIKLQEIQGQIGVAAQAIELVLVAESVVGA